MAFSGAFCTLFISNQQMLMLLTRATSHNGECEHAVCGIHNMFCFFPIAWVHLAKSSVTFALVFL